MANRPEFQEDKPLEAACEEAAVNEAAHDEATPREAAGYEAARHETMNHEDAAIHHHHSHATGSHHAHGHHLLQVEDLSVSFSMYDAGAAFFSARKVEVPTIHSLSLSVHEGELVAVVGASGSGKSLLADAVMGLYEPNAVVSGTIWYDGQRQDAASLKRLRGSEIAYIPQSVSNLDPLMKVGRQVRGVCAGDTTSRCDRQRELFAHYGLSEDVEQAYPFELSGGMARRVLLSCALVERPRLIVADEPTPGLDLDLAISAMADLRSFANEGGGVLLITHDIELALAVADRVAVFKNGTVVEETSRESFKSPETLRHPFTRALWYALPGNGMQVVDDERPAGEERCVVEGASSGEASGVANPEEAAGASAATSPSSALPHVKGDAETEGCTTDFSAAPAAGEQKAGVLEARDIMFAYPKAEPLYKDLSFRVALGERVALCAPSGFGKTTLCRLLAGFERPLKGRVLLDGTPLPRSGVCPVQLIGQHPENMVDPYMAMRAVLAEAGEVPQRLLDALGIREEWLGRHAHELSGGELQRFCIARALACRPRYLVADECTVMFDALTQARVWRTLRAWQAETGAGIVFVSHSPELVRCVATRTVDLTQLP